MSFDLEESSTKPIHIDDLRAYADAWQARMQQAVSEAGLSFTVPHRHESEEMEQITYEWWASQPPDRKLTVHIAESEDKPGTICTEYIRSWGYPQNPKMYDGNSDPPDTFRLLWQWLGY
jgi:hypothetical protein